MTNLDDEVTEQFTVSSLTNFNVSSLMPFTVYTIAIGAKTAVGIGPFSSIITIQTLEDGKFQRW